MWIKKKEEKKKEEVKTNSPVTEYTTIEQTCIIRLHDDNSIILNIYKAIGDCGRFIDEAMVKFMMRKILDTMTKKKKAHLTLPLEIGTQQPLNGTESREKFS